MEFTRKKRTWWTRSLVRTTPIPVLLRNTLSNSDLEFIEDYRCPDDVKAYLPSIPETHYIFEDRRFRYGLILADAFDRQKSFEELESRLRTLERTPGEFAFFALRAEDIRISSKFALGLLFWHPEKLLAGALLQERFDLQNDEVPPLLLAGKDTNQITSIPLPAELLTGGVPTVGDESESVNEEIAANAESTESERTERESAAAIHTYEEAANHSYAEAANKESNDSTESYSDKYYKAWKGYNLAVVGNTKSNAKMYMRPGSSRIRVALLSQQKIPLTKDDLSKFFDRLDQAEDWRSAHRAYAKTDDSKQSCTLEIADSGLVSFSEHRLPLRYFTSKGILESDRTGDLNPFKGFLFVHSFPFSKPEVLEIAALLHAEQPKESANRLTAYLDAKLAGKGLLLFHP